MNMKYFNRKSYIINSKYTSTIKEFKKIEIKE